jgi:hypothetical protein
LYTFFEYGAISRFFLRGKTIQKTMLAVAAATLLIGAAVTYQHARAQDKATTSRKQKTITQEPHLLACNLAAMTPAKRQRHDEIGKQLRKAARQVKELPDGYAFRYASDPALFTAAAESVSLESRCCSFYRFTLEKEPAEGPIWLRVRGPKETKTFIKPVLAP